LKIFTAKKYLILSGLLFCLLQLVHAAPLPGHDAFRFSAERYDPNTLLLRWTVAPGYFLYRDRLAFKPIKGKPLTIGRWQLPKSVIKDEGILGKFHVYRNNLNIFLPVLGVTKGYTNLDIHYQGCADSGFCYPPTVKRLQLHFDKALGLTDIHIVKIPPPTKTVIASPTGKTTWWLHLLSFYLLGLLLSFTPCVLPMVPIISGIIIGHGERITTKKAFALSAIYVLSMSLTYAAIGVVIALLGANLQATLQKPWIIASFAGVFVLLALSMFGFYNLNLPTRFEATLANLSRRQTTGTYLGVAVMGILATLILSPCVSAPLVGILGYIANTGDVVYGAVSLFVLSLGMGTPLILIGTSGAKLLPKTGMWMNTVKNIIGVLLLMVAIYLLSRILAPQLIMVLSGTLAVVCGVFMGAFRRSNSHWRERSAWSKCCQGLGIIVVIYGALLLIGASRGQTNFLKPLAAIEEAQPQNEVPFRLAMSLPQVQRLLAKAKQQRQPVLLDFYAHWCLACKIMEYTVFKQPKVIDALKPFMIIKADVTANDADNQVLLKHYNVVAPPTFIFFDRDGNEIKDNRIVGEVTAKDFLTALQKIK
jgi:thioredoxin:protein disulfide reductase